MAPERPGRGQRPGRRPHRRRRPRGRSCPTLELPRPCGRGRTLVVRRAARGVGARAHRRGVPGRRRAAGWSRTCAPSCSTAASTSSGDEVEEAPAPREPRGRPALAADLRLDRSAQAHRPHAGVADHGVRRRWRRVAGCAPTRPAPTPGGRWSRSGSGSPGQDLVVVDPAELEGWVAAGIEHGVTAASGTPTFWRQTIMSHGDDLAKVPLEQVSLGGEPVDQAVLDQLTRAVPRGAGLLDLRLLRARRLDRGARRPRRASRSSGSSATRRTGPGSRSRTASW